MPILNTNGWCKKIDFGTFKECHQEQKRIETLLNALQIAERKEALLDRLNKMSQKMKHLANYESKH